MIARTAAVNEFGGGGPGAEQARGRRRGLRVVARAVAGHRHEAQARRQRGQRCQELAEILGRQHADHEMQRPARVRACPGSRPAPGRRPGCGRRRARAWSRAARARSADPAVRRCRRAGQRASARPRPIAGARQPGLRRAAAPPSSRARHCRSGARPPAAAAADRGAARRSRPRFRPRYRARPSRGRAPASGAPISAARASITAERLRPLRPDHGGHARP